MSRFVVVIQLTALPSWLQLSRGERQDVVTQQLEPLLDTHPGCRLRWVDVEAFTAQSSDVLIVDVADFAEWNLLWEAVRDTDIFAVPFFRLDALIPGIEEGYVDYEASLAS